MSIYRLGPRRTRVGRSATWLVILVFASAVLLTLSRTDAGRAIHGGAREVLAPVVSAISAAADGVANTFGAVADSGGLSRENAELRHALATMQQRVAALEAAGRENAQLRELLGVAAALEMELLPARVIGREPSSLLWEVTVDQGTQDGVRPGMPVLAGLDGTGVLVGTVTDAGAGWSLVRFVVDERSVVAARAQPSGAIGDLGGQPGGQLVLRNVPVTEPIAVGDGVVTAGLRVGDDASRYPGGLLIGRVQAVELDPNAVTQTAYVVPAIDPLRVERFLIVLEFEQG